MTLASVDQKTDQSPAVSVPSDFCIEWNAENQLIRVSKDAVEVATFAYDPIGRRVEKVAGGVTYSYTYDGSDILQETVSDGATETTYRYIHGPGADEPLAREDMASAVLTYYHADGLGSITKITDQAGSVFHSYQYDAWGNIEEGASQPIPIGIWIRSVGNTRAVWVSTRTVAGALEGLRRCWPRPITPWHAAAPRPVGGPLAPVSGQRDQ